MAHCRIKPGVICLAFSQPPTPRNDGRSTTSPGLRFDNGAPSPFLPLSPVKREKDIRFHISMTYPSPGGRLQDRLYNWAARVTECYVANSRGRIIANAYLDVE